MNILVEITEANALDVFLDYEKLEPYVDQILQEVASVPTDVSTATSRDEIARTGKKLKTAINKLDKIGKDTVTALKEKPKLIDANRKKMRDAIDTRRLEILEPLEAWDQQQRERCETINQQIDHIKQLAVIEHGESSDSISVKLEEVNSFTIDSEFFGEFSGMAAQAKHESMISLKDSLEKAVKYEAEQKELAELRAEQEKRKAEQEKAEQEKQRTDMIKKRLDMLSNYVSCDSDSLEDLKRKRSGLSNIDLNSFGEYSDQAESIILNHISILDKMIKTLEDDQQRCRNRSIIEKMSAVKVEDTDTVTDLYNRMNRIKQVDLSDFGDLYETASITQNNIVQMLQSAMDNKKKDVVQRLQSVNTASDDMEYLQHHINVILEINSNDFNPFSCEVQNEKKQVLVALHQRVTQLQSRKYIEEITINIFNEMYAIAQEVEKEGNGLSVSKIINEIAEKVAKGETTYLKYGG